MWKLYVWSQTGSFFCHRCSSKGSWFDFKKRLGDLAEVASVSSLSAPSEANHSSANNIKKGGPKKKGSKTNTSAADLKRMASYSTNLFKEDFFPALSLMMGTNREQKQRGISRTVLQKYLVGAKIEKFQQDDGLWREEMCVTFPWTSLTASPGSVAGVTVERLKARSIVRKKNQRIEPKGGPWGLFGWHTVPPSAEFIVVTEGEWFLIVAGCCVPFPHFVSHP